MPESSAPRKSNIEEILTKSPNNLYALSNLGAVYFRTGRLKAAELTLKKAVILSPKDEFSRTDARDRLLPAGEVR